jgi:hypothetical protein
MWPPLWHSAPGTARVCRRTLPRVEASPYIGGRTRSWLKVNVPGWTIEGDQWSRRIAEPAV